MLEKITIDNVEIEYKQSGVENKGVIVFLHGLGANLSQFEDQHDYFGDRFRVISINLRGHGNSGTSRIFKREDFELQELARDVIMLLEALKIDKFHLVGNSMGGNVGYEMIQSHQSNFTH